MTNSPDFPSDIKDKVECLLSTCAQESLGSYTETQGLIIVREAIAKYIERRDGYPSNPSDIYISNGTTDGIPIIIKLLMNSNPKKPSEIVRLSYILLRYLTLNINVFSTLSF